MPEQEMTTEQERFSMSREQLESALAQREDQLRRSQAKLEVMQGAEPILLSEIRKYKSALKEVQVVLQDYKTSYRMTEDQWHKWLRDSDSALSAINEALDE